MFTPSSLSGKFFKKYLLFFSHPGKIRIQNIIGKKFFAKGISLKNEEGVSFKLDTNDWITRIMLREGEYEFASTALAQNILKNGGLFIDVGANFGLFTCITASNNESVKVLAIEPNHKVIQRLLDNITINGLQERVKVINTAVSKKNQLLSMEQPVSNNLGTTVTKPDINGYLSILSCSLEFICTEYKTETVDLIKIDIEGNEFDILENFPFEKYAVKNIILEFNHLSKISFEDLASFFEGKGFKSYTIYGDALIKKHQGIPENNIWFVNQLT